MAEQHEFGQTLTQLFERRFNAYKDATADLFKHLFVTVTGIKDFLISLGTDGSTVSFKDVEILENRLVFVVMATRLVPTSGGMTSIDTMFSVQIPIELVYENDQQKVLEFLTRSHLEVVDELLKLASSREDSVQSLVPLHNKRTLH
jgi:hypothetical protein